MVKKIHPSERGVVFNLLRNSNVNEWKSVHHFVLFNNEITIIPSYLNICTPIIDNVILTSINLQNEPEWQPIFYDNVLNISSCFFSFFQLNLH